MDTWEVLEAFMQGKIIPAIKACQSANGLGFDYDAVNAGEKELPY